MDINSAMIGIKQYLLGTREFMELKRASEALKQNPKANIMVQQFQKKQDSLYSERLSQSQLQYLMDDINRDYEQLVTNNEIKNFFNASENFNLLLNQFMRELNLSISNELA